MEKKKKTFFFATESEAATWIIYLCCSSNQVLMQLTSFSLTQNFDVQLFRKKLQKENSCQGTDAGKNSFVSLAPSFHDFFSCHVLEDFFLGGGGLECCPLSKQHS